MCRSLAAATLLPGLVRAAAATDSVTIFAAASLADVLRAIAGRWSGSGPLLRLSFAASSTLARQIEQGARADIFISADEAWMDHLARLDRIVPGSRRGLAGNRLVIVRHGPAGPAEIQETPQAVRRALLGADAAARIATGDPAHVPVGRYAQAALTQLGLWAEVAPRLVRADNVRSALAFVERGEAVAGIVYATDARIAAGSLHVAARLPLASHPPIRYPAALVQGAGPAAAGVLARLFLPQAQAALREAGFGPAEAPHPER